jgi:glycogen synthase
VRSLRVLMLGWEFPPHISGGLGTACHGLTRGLAKAGVNVTFVVPRAFGDEDRGPTRIVGANEIALDVEDLVADDGNRDPTQSRERRVSSDRSITLAVDSALLPYLSAEQYAERVRRLERSTAARTDVAPPPPEPPAPSDRDRRVQIAKRPLAFSGFYGPDLLAEVARYASVVQQIARRESFEVVHAHDWMTYPAGIAAARASGKPLVVHVHACEYDRSGDHVNESIVAIEREGLAAADRVICVSHFTAGIVMRRYGVDPSKIRVVHNAVTRREQREGWHVEKPPAGAGGPLVLFLGRVTFQKGPVYFLEAAARVVRVMPDVRFVMSGSGDMLPAMVERAAAMGLARHVRFTGFLSGADVERMYAMADLYVMPSVSEPFGISPLDAMALDVPVIVSRQSGVAEVLSSALKVNYWDVEDLAGKIVAVLRWPALREILTAEGRVELLEMRWEARAERVREIYEEVLGASAERDDDVAAANVTHDAQAAEETVV